MKIRFHTAQLSLVLALVAILVGVYAQYSHTFPHSDSRALILFLVALAVFAAALYFHRITIPTRLTESTPVQKSARRTSGWLQFAVVVGAILTYAGSSDNEFTSDNILAWGVSIVIFLYTFWEPQKNWNEWRDWARARFESARQFASDGFRVSSRLVLFIGIILVAIFFYYYNLPGVPAEMDSDHAEKLLDVNDIVTRGLRPIFFERNTGREPLQFYLTALYIGATGHPIDHMALKTITALMGVLVVIGTFFLTRELFDDDVAFPTAALIAMSKWPVTIARMGLRFPFTPVFVAPFAFFLFRALKRQSRNDFLLAGLFLGLGLLGYNAFRLAPLLAIVFVALWIFTHRLERVDRSHLILNFGLMAALALVVFMPVFRYSMDNPDKFWYRALTRLSNTETQIDGNPPQILAGNIWNAALMFNWTGDEAWPNTIPGDPALDYFSGGVFVLGVLYAFYRLIRHREWEYAFVILGVVVMQLPSSLSLAFPRENPSVVRAGGAIPFVFMLVALPLAWVARVTRESFGRGAMLILLLALFALIARANYLRYFRDFDLSYRTSSWNSSEVAAEIKAFGNSVGDYDHAYIMLFPHWVDTRNVAINIGRIGWDQTIPTADDLEQMADDPANKLIVLNIADEKNLARLMEIFPNAQMRVFHSRTPKRDFVLLYVPGSAGSGVRLGVPE